MCVLFQKPWHIVQVFLREAGQGDVLRGPASVLYGQASPGGFVNMTMKKAEKQTFYEVRGDGASYNYGDIMADMGGVVNKDKTLALRLTAVGRYGDTQVDFAKERHLAIMPQLQWTPTNDTSLYARFVYQYDPNSLYGIALPAKGTVLKNPNGKLPTSLNTSEPGFDKYRRSEYVFEAGLDHNLSDAIGFHQKFRYMRLDSNFQSVSLRALASDNATASRMATVSYEQLNSYNVDNNLQSHFDTGQVHHTLITGLDFLLADSDRALGNTVIPSLNLYDPVYGASFTPKVTSYATQSQTQLGLYIQDQAKYKNLSMIMGGRYDWASTSTHYKYGGTSSSSSDRAATYRGDWFIISIMGFLLISHIRLLLCRQLEQAMLGKRLNRLKGISMRLGLNINQDRILVLQVLLIRFRKVMC